MDISSNTGLIVVSLDGCLPTSVDQGDESALKADCLYTVAVMAPEGVLVPTSEASSCLQTPMEQGAEVEDISHSQDQGPAVIASAEQDEDYYTHILSYLLTQTFPEGTSEAQRTMIARRSRHYHVTGEQLYYGHKHPKKVICDEESQNEIMQSIHVLKNTGVHIGVQKMHCQLKKEFFWCGMYMDIIKFVRQCHRCVDADLPLSSVKTLANKRKLSCLENPGKANYVDRITRSMGRDKSQVWKQVELRLSGPYPEDLYVLSVADPFSGWLDLQVATGTDLGRQAADFLASTFCRFGFAPFSTVGFSTELLASLRLNYERQLCHLTSIKVSTTRNLLDHSVDNVLCPWVSDFLTSCMEKAPNSWVENLPKSLFEFRNSALHTDLRLSPFKVMFDREPMSAGENKENAGLRFSKRLQTSALKRTRHRQNIETRKITLKALKLQRQKRQKLMAKAEKAVSEDEDDPDEMVGDGLEAREEVPATSSENPEIREVCASTVAVVQALLTATRKERSRRGQYQRYSVELREEMANYALEHGSLAAVKHFSEKLNTPVSESTIRNFTKNYQTCTPELQEQIGAYAVSHNVDVTVQHFSALGYDVRSSSVRKFKKNYLTKYPEEKNSIKDDSTTTSTGKKKKIYNTSLREEMGQYAEQFGVAATVTHFSNKLQLPVKETTVRKFKKSYQEKQKQYLSVNQQQTLPNVTQTESLQTETMDVVQASFSVLNSSPSPQTIVYNQQSYQPLISPISFHQNHTTLDQSSYQQQSLPSVMNHNSQLVFSQATFQPHTTYTNTFTQLQTSNLHLPSSVETSQILSATDEHHSAMNQCNNSQMILSQHPILITHSQTQGDNNMTMHLDNLTSLPSFDSQMNNQHDNSTTINFLQPSSISFGPPLSTNDIVQQDNTNFSPVDIMDNNSAQLIRVIRVRCDDASNLKLVSDMVCNEVSESIMAKDTLENTPSTSTPPPLIPQENKNKPKSLIKSNKNIIKKKPKSKKAKNLKNRGNYTTYSPEIRAEIGCYAAAHGNQNAIIHFRGILGHDVPESTVRGLKEKYLAKMEFCSSTQGAKGEKPVTSLGFAPRGRPMRLGKYDEIVHQCIRDLVSNGERVSSFLAIATAKQVLTEHEPGLLAENGGTIKLTTNWAKSFLKRIGVHNNS